jgi:hypothetical protein
MTTASIQQWRIPRFTQQKQLGQGLLKMPVTEPKAPVKSGPMKAGYTTHMEVLKPLDQKMLE